MSWEIVKQDALIACKRYCCLCEKYKGQNMEVHHIIQRADGGPDSFDNAIPLCFDCHRDVGSYNPHHPKGSKYSPEELKRIRNSFYDKVKSMPRGMDTHNNEANIKIENNSTTQILLDNPSNINYIEHVDTINFN